MTAAQNRLDQLRNALARAIPVQRDHSVHDQVAADDRTVEALRAGCGAQSTDPVVRTLARWRASIVEGT